MASTRREFLTLAGLAGAAALLASCAPASPLDRARVAVAGGGDLPGPWPAGGDPAWRALSRLTFGPRPDELARVAAIGLDAWIDEQLAPAHRPDHDADLRVRHFDTLTMDPSLLAEVRPENARRELQSAALLRAIYSRRQLYELLVDFWGDHFNISTLKGDCVWLKTIDDREVIRPHALGRFGDLLGASMRSPAMLVYLDNQENRAGNPNENYARELLELHALGGDAGYTQRDVQEVARCLTGWTVDRHRRRGQVKFDPAHHDDREKIVLGRRIPAGGGPRDAERVRDLLLAHPALPRFIARKLARRFVADDPPATAVEAAAATFARTDGDIAATLRTILRSPDFAAAPPKLKRPFHHVVGALRQLAAEIDAGQPLLGHLAAMGQPLFQWLTPDGYPDTAAAWSGDLLARWQFALALATGAIPGTRIDLPGLVRQASATTTGQLLDRFGALLLGAPLPPGANHALVGLLGDEGDDLARRSALAALLAGPGYVWR
ncbi:MAG TPA: DUF1800 domain-containing protein [Thermomicrobiales bacterium]|nr:DUF1800 domain-containing protein [Thermomicrobiales bacterium]